MDLSKIATIKNAQKRQAEREAEKRRSEFFEENPSMKLLSDRIYDAELQLHLQTIRGASTAKLTSELKKLRTKWESELRARRLEESYFEPIYQCQKCKDTGFSDSALCSCTRKILASEFVEEYELKNMLDAQNFEHFDLTRFDDSETIPVGEKFISHRDIMKLNLDRAKKFVASFPNGESLLFIGGTGLGKTFLANCIAEKIIAEGYLAVYHRHIGLEILLSDQMSFQKSEDSVSKYRLLTEADLLIIDDLYTPRYENLAAALFEIIDIRQANRKSTVITTNLTSEEIALHFGERFHSRLKLYTAYKFFGNDMRSARTGNRNG